MRASLGTPALVLAGRVIGLAVDAKQHEAACAVTPEWPGWAGIKHAFVFGDSYTTTGFNHTILPAPSPSNPLGNPTYPGYTSANGPNWVDLLTVKYNASRLQTYNLASGGATVDSALVKPYRDTVLSVRQQVTDVFLPFYAATPPLAPAAPAWRGGDTLFAVWIGINDVGNSFFGGDEATAPLYSRILAVYADLLGRLHAAGARNFALLNVPPVDRSPLTAGQGREAQALERAAIAAFNRGVDALARGVGRGRREGANVWVVDAHGLFAKALDDPRAFEATAGYRNVTGFCESYQNGTPKLDAFNATCGVPVNQYFWLNSLHPTYPMHDVVAEGVAKALVAGPNVCDDTFT